VTQDAPDAGKQLGGKGETIVWGQGESSVANRLYHVPVLARIGVGHHGRTTLAGGLPQLDLASTDNDKRAWLAPVGVMLRFTD